MCGIIGVVGKKIAQNTFEPARDTLSRRGPDDAGLFFDSDDQVAFGHRRKTKSHGRCQQSAFFGYAS